MRLGLLTNHRRHRPMSSGAPPAELVINKVSFAPPHIVKFDDWFPSTGRYVRNLLMKELSGTTASLPFRKLTTIRSTGGGGSRPFGPVPSSTDPDEQAALRHDAIPVSYTLTVDGVPSAVLNITQPAKTTDTTPTYIRTGSFALDLTQLADGWHRMDIITPDPDDEAGVTYFFFVNKAGGTVTAAQPLVPLLSDSYHAAHNDNNLFWMMVPSTATPTPMPLTPRETPHFSTAVSRTLLYRTDVLPVGGHRRRLNVSNKGVISTASTQSYHFYHLYDKYPRVALLDGERNVGTASFLTHIQVDRHGGAYCCDPWRILRIDSTGKVTTRCGYRHNHPPPYWDETPDTGPRPAGLDLLGDWSAVPADRRGFHEMWGVAFDGDSISVENLATGDPTQANPTTGELEHPHSTGPRLFVPDSQNNRICLLTFSRNSFTAEPVVTEFITGINDPWDCVWGDGVLYVSERKDNRICAYNATTGAFIRVVVSGASGLAIVGGEGGREAERLVSLATIQAEDACLPEGLFLQDGWLYYTSLAQAQVKRVNLTTDVIEFVCNVPTDTNSRFVKMALSDGTFGPRGTVFLTTWGLNARGGMPDAFLPGATRWSFNTTSLSAPIRGKGGSWDSMSYPGASGVGLGRLYVGGAADGMAMISLALPTDQSITLSTYNAGKDQWYARGYDLVHGGAGEGQFGYPLPWGETPEMDYYLTSNGHTNG